MSAKLCILIALVMLTISMGATSAARPTMTRIQEVFRSLMAPEEIRGKKYYEQFAPSNRAAYFPTNDW